MTLSVSIKSGAVSTNVPSRSNMRVGAEMEDGDMLGPDMADR
jgi:hypothetical protein